MNAAVWILVLFLADGSVLSGVTPRSLIGCALAAKAANLQPGDSAVCFNTKTKQNRHILDGD